MAKRTLTKVHYEKLAQVVKNSRARVYGPNCKYHSLDPYYESLELVSDLVTFLHEDNPKFDIDRFLEASRVFPEKGY